MPCAPITAVLGQECIFCRIVERDAPASLVYDDAHLVAFLDELIYRKDVEELLLRATEVHVDAADHRVQAVLVGERIEPERHELVADVKGVTLHDLRVERAETGWHAYVTLDV